ncbi:mechanosensitive ion channel domain-containing protein [Arthrobacter sp. LAPM80]|uniref:mechanosensitive ion channel family protein n=1 Tax=Arthrobacter sp. LAPM80 TaxID=3141788 RepID=UPI00398AD382
MQATQVLGTPNDGFWENLAEAGVALAIALVAWLVLHYFIRLVVKRAKSDRTALDHFSLRWAAPVLRNLDPVMRVLDDERRVQRARTIGSLLNSVLTTVVAVVTGFYVLLAFNVDITPLLTSVGVLGIAIGFGCQQLIRDFLAGIFITLEDQYGIGDVIQTSEVIGTVQYLGLRITRVMAEDGTLWYLRNGEILRLGNRSKGNYQDPAAQPAPAATEPNESAE